MCKCKTPGCPECGNSAETVAQLANKVAEMEALVDAVNSRTKFLDGHPILMIENDSDIEAFNVDGLGTGTWEGWAYANGQTYGSGLGSFTTTNLLDKFVVGAGDTYAVGDTGGAATVTLTTNQIPAHNHGVTDPTHSHTITDPGHNHTVTQSAHNHSVTDPGHSHTASTSITPTPSSVQYSYINETANVTGDGGTSVPDTWTNNTLSLAAATTVASSNTGVTVANATIEMSINNSNTGVTAAASNTGITINNAGGGQSHENRPPYYAVIFIQKL